MSTAAVPSRQKNNNRDKGRGHIPNRAAYGNTNSHRREGPENETSSSSSSSSSVPSTPVQGVYRDSRTALMLCTFLGARTSVKTRNGKRYKGLTTGFSAEGDIALLDAKLETEDNLSDANMPGIVIPRETFVMCKAPGVDFKGLAVGSSDFTDAGIASRLNGNAEASMKVLQPWEDDGNEATTSLMLDENQKGWEPSEMFQVNSDKFNVQSSYSEDLDGYTTPKVAPNTEGYEERERFAAMKAEEIEKSDVYKARIAKELAESSEEAKYASVNDTPTSLRSFDGHNSGSKSYTIPALREEQNMRNAGRGQGRTPQRQMSPYSSSLVNHSQSHPNAHQPVHNSRNYTNNHYPHGPPGPPPPGRNPGPPHQRQQQQSPSPSHGPPIHHHHQQSPRSIHQQQPPSTSSQPPVQSPSSQQPQRSSSATQQLASPSSKVHSNVPATIPVPPGPKVSHIQQNPAVSAKGAAPLNSQQQIPVTSSRPSVTQHHVNGETKPNQMEVNALSQKFNKLDASARPEVISHKVNPPSASSSQTSIPPRVTESPSVQTATVADSTAQPVPGTTVAVTSPQQIPQERRPTRGLENNLGEARNKVNQQLQDFQKKFVLENATSSNPDPPRSEASGEAEEVSNPSSTSSSSVMPLSPMSPSATTESTSSEPPSAASSKTPEKSEENPKSSPAATGSIIQSKLNPLAKEFTPSVKTPSAGEAQSPSPQQRVSPQVHAHQMMAYASPMYGYVQSIPPGIPTASLPTGVMSLPTQKNRHATVSVGRVSDLTAHQAHHVTGQPLLATSPQMFYMPSSPSAGFQVVNMGNPGSRMVTPSSFPMPQTGQPGPIDPANPQAQPQPVFLTGQQHQAMPGPMPAHLTQHPQPAHAQAIPNPSPNPTAQPTHVPNPAPSPVQHQPQQQTAQQYGGQPMSHISQGPPQSANPQPSHFPPMSLHHGLPTMPRTSMAGQHGMTQSGHPSVSISYSLSTPHSYHNANPGHHTLTPAAQPQTSQNSNHNSGQQPHFVVMPHTNPHQPMQQQHHGQAYTATGIQFQSGHNIVQGPSQMPPNHTPNSQGAAHIYHPGMQAMPAGIQQVPGTPSGMYMQVPSTLQQFQHQQ